MDCSLSSSQSGQLSSYLVAISHRSVCRPNLDSCTSCCVSYLRPEHAARVENKILSLSLSLLLSFQHDCILLMQPSQLASPGIVSPKCNPAVTRLGLAIVPLCRGTGAPFDEHRRPLAPSNFFEKYTINC